MKRSVVDDIVQPLTTALGSDKTRISMALAVAIAYSLPLPSQPLKSGATPELFYVQYQMIRVNRFISDFNERFLIDVAEIGPAIKTIYCVRYDMLYPRDATKLLAIAKGECPIRDYLAGFAFDEEVSNLVISAGIASIERIERVLLEESSATSAV